MPLQPELRRSLSAAGILSLATILLVSVSELPGEGKGVFPGTGKFPKNVTTAYPSCGKCHGSFPGSGINAVQFTWTGSTSLLKGRTSAHGLAFTSAIKGINGEKRGGFVLRTKTGSFTAAGNTKVDGSGTILTHSDAKTRSWSFQFKPATTGLVEWFAVGNAGNADGTKNGDSWGWCGPSPSSPGTPHRLYVNDSNVQPVGKGCVGSKGFVPIQGGASDAGIGQDFKLDLVQAPPKTAAINILGASAQAWGAIPLPFALDAFGAKGCKLYISMDFLVPTATSAGKAGEGQASWTWPIPNQAALKGSKVHFQTMVLDQGANTLGITMSNGTTITVQ